MPIIKHIYKTSPFYKKVLKGDNLIKINGKKIVDILDYMFFSSEENEPVQITIERNGKFLDFSEIITENDFRFEFEESLLDEQKSCENNCIFCFINQLPKNMRETMYYRDDDYRLSILQGNYVTLTNLTNEDVERICEMRISPLNISVHTTDPDLRIMMMNNPNAGKINDYLAAFCEAGINMRCQIVLCKGINDKAALEKTMSELTQYFPNISSVSIVPAGLTKFREHCYPLEVFNKQDSIETLQLINEFGEMCLNELGTRLFYPSDEWYVKSEIPFPGYDFYEEFEQLENGVGMVMCFAQEFRDAMSVVRESERPIDISLVTGVAAEKLINTCLQTLSKKLHRLKYNLYIIKNDFFGENITVAGLITGSDIISQLKDKELGKYLIIPSNMLRDDLFLDDVSVSDVEKALNITIKVAGSRAEDLINTIIKAGK